MSPILRTLAGIIALSLPAQSPPFRAFKEDLKRSRPALLVVFGPASADQIGACRRALADESLSDFAMPMRVVGQGRYPVAQELAADLRKTWGLTALVQWALVSPKGEVLAKGAEPPKPALLAATLSAAGLRPPLAEVEAFLALHPDHLEARARQLLLLRERAVRRTRDVLRLEQRTLQELDEESRQARPRPQPDQSSLFPKNPVQLGEAQDRAIWGPYAQILEQVFVSGDYREIRWGLDAARTYPAEAHSPLMAALFRRVVPRVQTAIQVLPSSTVLWNQWIWMSLCARMDTDRGFIVSLQPPPAEALPAGQSWPPDEVRKLLVTQARKQGQWGTVAALLWVLWEDERALGGRKTDVPDLDPLPPVSLALLVQFREADWKSLFEPLIEALVRSGDEAKAAEVVGELSGWKGWRGLKDKLMAVAVKAGKPALARSWAQTQPGE